MSSNPYDGSQHYGSNNLSSHFYVNHVSGISGLVPSSMTENGWQYKERSTPYRTVWQYIRPLENGRYDQIRLDEDEKEGVHLHIKIMMGEREKPTKEHFIRWIAPQLKKNVKKTLKKDEE